MINLETRLLIDHIWTECSQCSKEQLIDALNDGEFLASIGVDDQDLLEDALAVIEGVE